MMAVPQRHPTPTEPATPTSQHLRAAPRPSRKLMPMVGCAAAVTVVVALFALALIHAMIVDRQTTLDNLNQELEEVQAANDRLRFNVARAEAPERIMAEALYRLGMVEPNRRVYLSPVELDEDDLLRGG